MHSIIINTKKILLKIYKKKTKKKTTIYLKKSLKKSLQKIYFKKALNLIIRKMKVVVNHNQYLLLNHQIIQMMKK